MSDPFTPDTPHLGSDDAQSDSRDLGRRQDPTGAPQERSFRTQEDGDTEADEGDVNRGVMTQNELDAREGDNPRGSHGHVVEKPA